MRVLLSGFVLLGTIGCSDMLGLGGLTYDQGVEESERAAVMPEGTTRVGDGLGGLDPGPGDYQDPDFPTVWPSDVKIASVPAQGQGHYYWVYFPDSNRLHTYLYRPEGPDLVAENDWPADWPQGAEVNELLAFNDGGAPLLVVYSDSGLLMRLKNVLRSGELTFDLQPASGALSHVRAMKRGEHDVIVSYDALDGDYRCVPLESESEAPAGVGQLESGFNHVEPYEFAGRDGLLFYHADEGRLEFWAFGAEGVELELLFSDVLDFPVTELVTFQAEFGEGVLFYDAGQGLARVRRLLMVDDMLELGEYGGDWQSFEEEAYLPQGLTRLLPLASDDWALLGFNGSTVGVFGGTEAQLHPIVVK